MKRAGRHRAHHGRAPDPDPFVSSADRQEAVHTYNALAAGGVRAGEAARRRLGRGLVSACCALVRLVSRIR